MPKAIFQIFRLFGSTRSRFLSQFMMLVEEIYGVGRRAFMASLMQFPATQALSLIQNVLVLRTMVADPKSQFKGKGPGGEPEEFAIDFIST